MTPDCLFCKIADGRIPASVVLENEHWLAFEDLHPQAPVHVLVIPKRHLASVDAAGDGDHELLGRLLGAAREVAAAKGLSARGYRVVTNVGAEAGQSVFHLHLHVLGGRAMHWPPG